MTDSAFITMIIVLSLVWGGFGILLTYAIRRESRKPKLRNKTES